MAAGAVGGAAEAAGRATLISGSALISSRQDAVDKLMRDSQSWIQMPIPRGATVSGLKQEYTALLETKSTWSKVVAETHHDEEKDRVMKAHLISVGLAQLLFDQEGDAEEIVQWLDVAVAGGTAEAAHNMAYMMELNKTSTPSDVIAMYSQSRLACSFYRAGLIMTGMSGPNALMVQKGLCYIQAAADAGHPEANFVIGSEYARGRRTPDGSVDPANSVPYLEVASKSGLTLADQELGIVYTLIADTIMREKISLTEDDVAAKMADRERRAKSYAHKAMESIRHGAEHDDIACIEMLGRSLIRGYGVKKNDKQGYLYLKRAGDAGSAPAMHDAARMIRDGVGVKRDTKKAVAIMKQLANESGHPPAMCDLALLLEREDPTESMRYLNAAIDKQYLPAMAHLIVEKIEEKGSNRYTEIVAHLAAAAREGSTHPHIHLARKTLVIAGELHTCAHCDSVSRTLQKCGRCEIVSYCSRSCQALHWSTHKTKCANTKKTPDAH